MSSEHSEEPAGRSPEELAAVLADLAAAADEPYRPGEPPVWRVVGEERPAIWRAPRVVEDPPRSAEDPLSQPEDPLSQLDRQVAEVEARVPRPTRFRSSTPPPTAPPMAPPLQRVGEVPQAWSTVGVNRTAPVSQSPRTKLVSGVIAAARRLGGRRHGA